MVRPILTRTATNTVSYFIYKSLDAAMTASLRPRRKIGAHLRSIVSPRSSNYDRVASLVNMFDTVAPGFARGTKSALCGELQLPFPVQRAELLAFGSGSTVFRLDTDDGRKVVKFYRRSLGAGPARLLAFDDSAMSREHAAVEFTHATPVVHDPDLMLVLPTRVPRGHVDVEQIVETIDESI